VALVAFTALLMVPATALAASPASSASPGSQINLPHRHSGRRRQHEPVLDVYDHPLGMLSCRLQLPDLVRRELPAHARLADPVPTVANGGITDGGRVWTFHLRPNVKWSDGVPLTAATSPTPTTYPAPELGMTSGTSPTSPMVEATDAQTVVITAASPTAC